MRTNQTTAFWQHLCDRVAPRERWSPSEWAERAPRIIPDNGVNPEPGPMKFDRTPYLREIADTIVAPGVEVVVMVKPTQVGYTTLLEMLPGYWADMDPGACMIVEPDEMAAKAMLTRRVLPTIEATPCLKGHMSERAWDKKRDAIHLDTMPIFAAWAGSPMRVAMWSIRYILFDEVDKYPRFAGDEGDPIMLGLKRISNWLHRGRAVIGSTPTIRQGNVWTWWESCGDRRRFHVPCPHCGAFQVLIWSNVKWKKPDDLKDNRTKLADRIDRDSLAWYECGECKGEIRDSDKPQMLRRGVWAGEDQVVHADGRVVGARLRSKRIGFHISAIYSPWVTFSTLAAEYVLAIGNPPRMMDFRNSRLAEPFEEQATTIKTDVIRRKIERAETEGWRPMVAPRWAGVLALTVDTQKDHFWAVLRAWGHQFRSRLLMFDRLDTFDDVMNLLRTPVPVEGGGQMAIQMCLIDSGGTADPETGASRTFEVYQFSLRNPAQILPTKGASHKQLNPIRRTQVTPKMPDGMASLAPVQLAVINTMWFKDILASRIMSGEVDWELTNAALEFEYERQLLSEHKIFNRSKNDYEWRPISGGAPNHAWDCETLQCVAADICNVNMIPAGYLYEPPRQVAIDDEPRRSGGGGFKAGYGGKY